MSFVSDWVDFKNKKKNSILNKYTSNFLTLLPLARNIVGLFLHFVQNILSGLMATFFLMGALQCAYKRNTILNSVRQHNCFITQGNYIGYMFRL